ncbi:MAG: hypothetical protein ACREMH_08210 [Gemmatimonadales bacterium]
MRRAGFLALAVPLTGAPLAAQQPAVLPTYGKTAGCFVFAEQVSATSRSETGGRQRTVTVRRDGRLSVRMAPGDGGLSMEAWYASLRVYAAAPEGREEPDASGLIGGRWRGVLDPAGAWKEAARPFVPDGLRAVMELGGLLEDFFPRAPLHRVIAREDTVSAPGGRGSLAARTTGDETWTVGWGEGPMPARWDRRLETVTTARDSSGAVHAVIRLVREGRVEQAGRCEEG